MTNKIALVTGATRGIGKTVSIALMEDGYTVVLAGRSRDSLAATVADAAARGLSGHAAVCDVTDPASVADLFAFVGRTCGRLDLLFNNAGIFPPGDALEDVRLEDWTAAVATNLTGPFLCTQAAFRMMKAQDPRGGRIINNGSISAHAPRPNSVGYTATKHAVSGLTKSTSLDGRKHNIACGQIDIGNAATDMASHMSAGTMQADGRVVPEPLMDVSAVAKAVVYMAGLPLEANVLFMTVMASAMPFVGRG
jgi:NAD(P)-dependent dehydrogenase (short-subunit alcohol dehydrogenase family)